MINDLIIVIEIILGDKLINMISRKYRLIL